MEAATGLRVEGLKADAGGRSVVDGLDLVVARGRCVGVVGPSGAGKSLLLAVLAGLVVPDDGRVLLDGEPVSPDRCGIVAQQHELVGALTAAENVATRILARRPLEAADWDDITALLDRLGLPESSWHNLLEQLSGGQQQRVAIARALIDAPALLVLDDPVSELDEASAERTWAVIGDAVALGAVVAVACNDTEIPLPLAAVVTVPFAQTVV